MKTSDVKGYFEDNGFPIDSIELWNMLWGLGYLISVETGLQLGSCVARLTKQEHDWEITSVYGKSPIECLEKMFNYIASNDIIDDSYKS